MSLPFAPLVPRYRRALASLFVSALVAGCGAGSGADPAPATAAAAGAASSTAGALGPVAALGEKIFHDPNLSASGRLSCAGCHAPETGYSAPNALAVQLGGPALDVEGARAAPGLRYLSGLKAFAFGRDGTPAGGFFRDGRAASLADQAAGPFLNPGEMANASPADVIARLARGGYADEFRRVFGADILDRPDEAFERVKLALQRYQLEDPDFRPFSSKFDAFLAGRATLTPQEMRGLALYNAPSKGNCAACHPSGRGPDGSPPLFTDFTYDTLGVPRNRALAANADPAHFDLGLCARGAGDLAARTDLCGAFRVPSLRNAALRRAFFHNGVFSTLRDVVRFYVQRDVFPERFYPLRADGTVDLYDDLPEALRRNVNRSEGPYDRGPGDAPALDDAEIEDVVAFIGTLSDGWPAP